MTFAPLPNPIVEPLITSDTPEFTVTLTLFPTVVEPWLEMTPAEVVPEAAQTTTDPFVSGV